MRKTDRKEMEREEGTVKKKINNAELHLLGLECGSHQVSGYKRPADMTAGDYSFDIGITVGI